jgi:Spy/CpxP family protein refolding chaperone
MTAGARARWTAGGLLLLALVAGALGGAAADRLLGAGPAPERAEAPPRGARRGAGGRGAIFPPGVQLARELDLTPEQRRQIQAILAEERAKADSVMRAVRPILQARYDSSTQAVREVLTPEQRERFDRLREARRERLRARRPR